MQNLLHIGTLKKPHGIKGAICFLSKTLPRNLALGLELYTHDKQPFVISKYEEHHQKIVCFSEIIADRTAAEKWQGTQLFCDRDSFFKSHPDQVFEDLCHGYAILDNQSKHLGILQYCTFIQDIPMLTIENQQEKLNLPLKLRDIDHNKKTIQLDYTLNDY